MVVMSSESLVRKEDGGIRSAPEHSKLHEVSISNILSFPSLYQIHNSNDFSWILMEFPPCNELFPEHRFCAEVGNLTQSYVTE